MHLLACQGDKDLYGPADKEVLADSVWANLITELYMAEALKNKRAIANRDVAADIRYIDSAVVVHYGFTPEEFETAWYELGEDLERFTKVMDLVLEQMTRLEEQIKTDTLRTYDFPNDFR